MGNKGRVGERGEALTFQIESPEILSTAGGPIYMRRPALERLRTLSPFNPRLDQERPKEWENLENSMFLLSYHALMLNTSAHNPNARGHAPSKKALPPRLSA